MSRILDVTDVINAHPVSRTQKLVIALCFAVVAIDGFDTAAIGFIAPALKAGWGVTPAELAPLFAAGLFGLMAGALVFGPLADRFGRKPVLVATTVFFGLATGATVGGGLMSMGRDLGTVFAAAAVPALVAALAMLAKSRLARPEPAVPAAVPAE